MKIVFLGLASTYTPGLTYQDNYLCTQTLADGHAVTYLSNPEKFVNGEIVETGAEDTVLPDGLHLIRLPYVKLGTDIVTKKVRVFRGVYDILEREKPDRIFCHGLQFWSVRDVIRYKKALIHICFCFFTKLCPLFDISSEDISSRNVWDFVLSCNFLSLCAFSSSWRT